MQHYKIPVNLVVIMCTILGTGYIKDSFAETLAILMREELQSIVSLAHLDEVTGEHLQQLTPVLADLKPLINSDLIRTQQAKQLLEKHNLTRYYLLDITEKSAEERELLQKNLSSNPLIQYIELEPPVAHLEESIAISYAPAANINPVPNLIPLQYYLKAPDVYSADFLLGGINAHAAWECKGGDGTLENENTRIVSVEIDRWSYEHINLKIQPFLSIWNTEEFGTEGPPMGRHDTSSAGIMFGRKLINASGKPYGIRGIASEAQAGYTKFSPQELARLLDLTQKGDVIQIGVQYAYSDPELSATFDCEPCLMPVEYWQANYDIISALTEKGVHVVIAAANGNIDLDNDYFIIKDPKHEDFGKPYFGEERDSGSIYAGAADPSTGAKAGYSEYGSRVQLYSWGYNVTTTDYIVEGHWDDQNTSYTQHFSGTSSANPIIAGAVASLRSIGVAHGISENDYRLSPKGLRQILIATGTPLPLANPLQPIGMQPNLEAAIKVLLQGECEPA